MPEAQLSKWIEFGMLLKHHRRQQGLTLDQLREASGFSVATLSKVENAQRAPTRQVVVALDQALRKNGDLLRLWEKARQAHSDPEWYRQVVTSEEHASEIRMWHPLLIPGFMQTREYARVIFRDGGPADSDEEVAELAELRVTRLDALKHGRNPRMLAIIAERTIRDVVGSPQIMRKQLQHLLSLSEQVETLVLPGETPFHGGSSGPFRILDFPDRHTQVYAEHAAGGELVADPDEVKRLVTVFGDLLKWALPPRASRTLIEKGMGEL